MRGDEGLELSRRYVAGRGLALLASGAQSLVGFVDLGGDVGRQAGILGSSVVWHFDVVCVCCGGRGDTHRRLYICQSSEGDDVSLWRGVQQESRRTLGRRHARG